MTVPSQTDSTSERRPRSDGRGSGVFALAGMAAAAAWWLGRGRQGRMSFRGRTVLISGGARGLGLALAREFARDGAHLVLFSRSEHELEQARAALEMARASVTTTVCDIRESEAAGRVVEEALGATGRIDVLVNNAGIIQMTPFKHATDGDFDDALRTFFWGPLHLIRACLPHLRQSGQGRIVNISSIGGRIAVPHLLPYCVGKFALSALSDGIQAELAASGVLVTTVSPGLMRTGSHRNVIVRGRHEQEALWFGLAGATPLTSMRAERAARIMVDACRAGRPRVTVGWQARVAQVVNAAAPAAAAAVATAAAAWLLPEAAASADGRTARRSLDLDLGWPAALMPTGAAARFNQPEGRIRQAEGA